MIITKETLQFVLESIELFLETLYFVYKIDLFSKYVNLTTQFHAFCSFMSYIHDIRQIQQQGLFYGNYISIYKFMQTSTIKC